MTLTWHQRPDSGPSQYVAWAAGHGFYGIAAVAGGYQFSVNGVNWASRSLSDSFKIQAMANDPSGDVLIAVGFTSPSNYGIIRSNDGGATWTPKVSPWDSSGAFSCYITGVDWSPSQAQFCCSGAKFSGGAVASRVATSPDGNTWTGHTAPWGAFDQSDQGFKWIEQEGIWIAGDQFGGIWTSPDAITWANVTTLSDPVYNFDYLPGLGIVASLNDFGASLIAHSPDAGVTWTEVATPQDQGNWLTVYNGRIYVAGYDLTGPTQSPSVYSTADAITFDQELLVTGLGNGQANGIVASTSRIVTVVDPGTSDLVYFTGTAAPVTGPVTPLWRYFIADLSGAGITDYSKLASGRTCEVILNGPLSLKGTVPSDNPQVWIPYDGDGYDDPYLSEGTRLLWGFRRESNTPPYYTVRAATLVQLVQDEAQQDDATTEFVGWDPWHYLFSRPVVNSAGGFPGPDGLSFTNTQASVVIASLLKWSIDSVGHTFIDAGVTYSGTADWAGTLETDPGMEIDINFAQGTTIGQAWQQVTNMGVCDIVLDPIYDPFNRPNYLVELNVYAEAGSIKDEQIFAWDMPGRSLVGLTRQEDGSDRANRITFFAGQGGSWGQGETVDDVDSQTKYGVYEAVQFFPAVTGAGAVAAVTSLAEQQLALRKNGKRTVTLSPAPERSPRPWQDYQLGDRVPVWASAQRFRKLL